MRATSITYCLLVLVVSIGRVYAEPPHPQRMTIAELDVKVTNGANSRDEIQRNIKSLIGTSYITDGIVIHYDMEDNFATIKGDTNIQINCEFDSKQAQIKEGRRITIKGVLAGYFFGTQLKHCSLYNEEGTQRARAPLRPRLKPPAPTSEQTHPPSQASIGSPQVQPLADSKQPQPPIEKSQGRMVCTPRRTGGERCEYVENPRKEDKTPEK